jgi:ABC-type transport system involved in multi-copper enzyme maturation permease subunit
MSSLLRILALGRLIFIDGLRRRALLGLFLLAVSVEVAGLFFFGFVPRDIGRVLVDYVVTIGWAAGMLFLLFHAVQVLAWGEDRRVIQTLLAHPISRQEYVVGLFSGLLGLLLLFNLILMALSYGVLTVIKGSVGPAYFSHLDVPAYLLAWLGVVFIEMMILSVIVLFSGLVRGGFSVLLLTVAYYLICNGLSVAREFMKGKVGFNDHLLTGLSFFFPRFDRWDYKGLVVMLDGLPSARMLSFDLVFGLLYAGLALVAAAQVYGRRDIK